MIDPAELAQRCAACGGPFMQGSTDEVKELRGRVWHLSCLAMEEGCLCPAKEKRK